jgi:hypothetical protein
MAEHIDADDPCQYPEATFAFFRTYAVLNRFVGERPRSAFLFLGNSVSFWWLIMRIFSPQLARQLHIVPISLQEYLMQNRKSKNSEEVKQQLSHDLCYKLFPSVGVTREWLDAFDQIFLIDYAFTGRSLLFMETAVKECFPSKQVKLFVIHGEESESAASFRLHRGAVPSAMVHYYSARTVMGDVLDRAKFPRLVQKYPPNEWGTGVPFDSEGVVRSVMSSTGDASVLGKDAVLCVRNLLKFYREVWVPLEEFVIEKADLDAALDLMRRSHLTATVSYLTARSGATFTPHGRLSILKRAISGKAPMLKDGEARAPYALDELDVPEDEAKKIRKRMRQRHKMARFLGSARRLSSNRRSSGSREDSGKRKRSRSRKA